MIECIGRQTRPNFPKKFHIRRSAHIVNLVIQEGLKKTNDYILNNI